MEIYSRYLFRELLISFTVVVLSLELMIGGNVLARWLGRVAQGRYPLDVVVPFLFHGSVDLLVTVLPFAAMLAAVLTLGRQQQSGELNAALFLRLSHGDVCAALTRFALPLAAFLFLMLMFVVPNIQHEHERIKQEAKRRVDVSVVTPGKFISPSQNLVLFVEKKDGSRLSRLFAAEPTEAGILIETAAAGEQKTGADQTRWLHFYNGTRLEGMPGDRHFQISAYREHAVLLPAEAGLLPPQEPEFKTLDRLLVSDLRPDQAELHWRLSLVFSLVVLVLLAFVLVRLWHKGPYQAVVPAALVYIAYINVLLMLSHWTSHARLPVYALWLGHLPLVLWIAWSLSWRPAVWRTWRAYAARLS